MVILDNYVLMIKVFLPED